MKFNNKYFKYTLWMLSIVLILFYIGQLTSLVNFIKTILTIILLPSIIASFFYYLLRPSVQFLVKKKFNKTIAIISVFLVIIAFGAILTTFAGRVIVKEFSSFYETILEYFRQSPSTVKELFSQNEFWNFSLGNIENNLLDSSQAVFQVFTETMSRWVTNITEVGTIIILIPIITFFLLKDDKLLYSSIVKVIPSKFKDKGTDIIGEIDDLLQKYFLGQLVVAGFLGVLTYIGYLIIGLPNALFLATFSMIFSIIPFLGPLIGIIPAIFLGWTVGPFMILKVIIILGITQQLEGNVIRPKIMGNRLNMHPMIIIFLVVIAIAIYGFIGAFFVIPLYGMLRIVVKHLVEDTQN